MDYVGVVVEQYVMLACVCIRGLFCLLEVIIIVRHLFIIVGTFAYNCSNICL